MRKVDEKKIKSWCLSLGILLDYRNYIFLVNYLNLKRMTQAQWYLLFQVNGRISSRRRTEVNSIPRR